MRDLRSQKFRDFRSGSSGLVNFLSMIDLMSIQDWFIRPSSVSSYSDAYRSNTSGRISISTISIRRSLYSAVFASENPEKPRPIYSPQSPPCDTAQVLYSTPLPRSTPSLHSRAPPRHPTTAKIPDTTISSDSLIPATSTLTLLNGQCHPCTKTSWPSG